jgi:hypothetical protein
VVSGAHPCSERRAAHPRRAVEGMAPAASQDADALGETGRDEALLNKVDQVLTSTTITAAEFRPLERELTLLRRP